MSGTNDTDENDDETGDIMEGLMADGLDWMVDLLKHQTNALRQANQTMTAMKELLSPANIELMDEVLGAMLIYVDDYTSLIETPDGLTQEQRDFIFHEEVTKKADQIVKSLSDDKLRGMMLGMTFMLQHEAEGKDTTLVACDIYHLIKTILNERTGLKR